MSAVSLTSVVSAKTKKKAHKKPELSTWEKEQRSWLAAKIEALTCSLPDVSPSEWAEQNRWLPRSVSNSPGYYSFDKTPYLREICDSLGPESEVREIAWMKGSQIGATTGIENILGFIIAHLSSAPVLWVTADQEMANQRMQANILPCIQQSGLSDRIKSNDEGNKRKTGQTASKLDFAGGGSLRTIGAQNANKIKSDAVHIGIADELDGWPELVGKDGDPVNLLYRRTASFEDSRKLVWISTPTLKGQSKIERQFTNGDQRYYNVCCLKCKHSQVLRWRRENGETGEVSGITWDTDPETHQLIPGSVRYLCSAYGHAHRNEDKQKLLSPAHGARWIPTAMPVHPTIRSYHLSALYSPWESWESCVRQWLAAWDVEAARPRDMGLLHAFYNNILGEPFELRGDKLRFEEVSSLRRSAYRLGEVPNKWAAQYAGSTIQLLTAAIDVQGSDLAVGVFGWTRGKRCFLIDYWRHEGATNSIHEPSTWAKVKELIQSKVYTADDGKRYKIALALVDSGHETSVAYDFVAQFQGGVVAIKGESSLVKSVSGNPFRNIHTPLGDRGFGLNVDLYKERWHLSLKQGWDRERIQPEGYFNAPTDLPDEHLRELTVEKRVEEIDPRTRLRRGWKWHRPSGAKNELWDTLIYASAGVDITASRIFKQLGVEKVDWNKFWAWTESSGFFLYKGP